MRIPYGDIAAISGIKKIQQEYPARTAMTKQISSGSLIRVGHNTTPQLGIVNQDAQ